MGATNVVANASNVILDGGKLETGATVGFSETFGTLTLQDSSSSIIALGTGSHSITFANSASATWGAESLLTVTGWTGSYGTTGTSGKIFMGVSGLTEGQIC